MKEYGMIAHIMTPNAEIRLFQPAVEKAIVDIQKQGFRVEVQYQQTSLGCSALVLGHKRKESE